jgi:hypothetical protein
MPRAEIASKQAKFTLLKLHAELGGKIIENRKEAERLRQAMRHVEAVLKLLDPSYSLRSIAVRRRKVNPWFKRGTLLRHALDVLRTADKPLTTREVVLRMLAAKGVTNASGKQIHDLFGGVQAALRTYKGATVSNSGQSPARWATAAT